MVKGISILGSTGSIGRQTAKAASRLGIPIRALAARRDTALLEEQARQLRPEFVAVYEPAAAADLRIRLADTPVRVGDGEEALCAAAVIEGADCVVTGVSGSIGLRPTLAAIGESRRIALANKETLVCAGELVMAAAERCGAEILPVDSEHSAIFQCLTGRDRRELRRILLTGSGGPFRGWTREQTASVTPEQAVRHPNWNMGAKISVDSATMMNKGLEFVEAMHLFGVTPDQIKVLVHPESAVHSMVELLDGTVIAQLGVPDMGLPIQYALTWPERRRSETPALDFAALGAMHFEEPDLESVPCLRLAMECARRGGTAPCVMSAANEIAVAAFLGHRIGYNDIYRLVASAVEDAGILDHPTLGEILDADAAAREHVRRDLS
ncbi:MAG: 1-deoxy-D-xylulose-5-phosphate reductoisomerase [Oscillospiraceae bacterium]|nr:1-deoxy-D-xylulose-5-phosphate reductoisomerase [Oscillospiraceae bacterium]